MKHIIIALGLFQFVASKSPQYENVRNVRYENVAGNSENYKLGSRIGEEIKQEQIFGLKTLNRGNTVAVEKGVYSYFAPDGSFHKVEYTADENGFHPQVSEIVPVPRPVSIENRFPEVFGSPSVGLNSDVIKTLQGRNEPTKKRKQNSKDKEKSKQKNKPKTNRKPSNRG